MAVELMTRSNKRKRIFSSVFPTSSQTFTTPTPVATPQSSFTTPGQPFGGFQQHSKSIGEVENWSNPIQKQIQWEEAWHVATTYLKIPDHEVDASTDDVQRFYDLWIKERTQEIQDAIIYLLDPTSAMPLVHREATEDALIQWYVNEVRRHFLKVVHPAIFRECSLSMTEEALKRSVGILGTAKVIYFHPLLECILPSLFKARSERMKQEIEKMVEDMKEKFLRDLKGIIAFSLEGCQLWELIAQFFRDKAREILDLSPGNDNEDQEDERMSGVEEAYLPEGSNTNETIDPDFRRRSNSPSVKARSELLHMAERLHSEGIGTERVQRVLAEVLNDIMSTYVKTTCSAKWELPSVVIDELKEWTEDHFARLIVELLYSLGVNDPVSNENDSTSEGDERTKAQAVSLEEVKRWQEMAITRLGRLRISELFSVIVDWDYSKGAVEDLKHYVTTPVTRTYLTTSFAAVLSQRLLQPGASTVEILQVYISLIRAFTFLDPKGVLLDRVARPVRRYLRDREDTVKVIVAGLLAPAPGSDDDEDEVEEGAMVLSELAVELNNWKDLAAASKAEDEGDLDWDDLNWNPDPVDAGPDYKKNKNADVINSLITLFESKEVFVKEFQNVIAERLLKTEGDLVREIRVLELLKLRFGEAALQACDVMLRDVLDSRRVNGVIRIEEDLQTRTSDVNAMQEDVSGTVNRPSVDFNAKILSRLFWPALHEEDFSLPAEISDIQDRYERGFEKLKQSRKLTWLHALGRMTVELDLEDRVITEEVTAWQASVIYAFQGSSSDAISSTPTVKTVAQLVEQLQMDETLTRNALAFWVGKLVLKETSKDSFVVLETLDGIETDAAGNIIAASAPGPAATVSAVKSEEEVAMEKMGMYWQFILGMLTNQGAMPLQRISMMLKFAVPGGFPYGDEQLKDFLTRKLQEGVLEMAGANYKIVR